VKTLNEVYSSLSTRRRYEVWFVRLGLASGRGAWWLRYLLTNPGRERCAADACGLPVQVWATWFPCDGKPRSFIQEFSLDQLSIHPRGKSPFHFQIGANEIGDDFCRGKLTAQGHDISWDLQIRSSFRVTMNSKGWIGFSRTPHSDAVFAGHITLDGETFAGDPLGFGLQGHNCGYRHRNFWTWTHAFFPDRQGTPSTLEALTYEMPLGLVFRKAILWHRGQMHEFRKLVETVRDRNQLLWTFRCSTRDGLGLEVAIDGTGAGVHRLPYAKTDGSGTFEVINNSRAKAMLRMEKSGRSPELLETNDGAVLEMAGGDSTWKSAPAPGVGPQPYMPMD